MPEPGPVGAGRRVRPHVPPPGRSRELFIGNRQKCHPSFSWLGLASPSMRRLRIAGFFPNSCQQFPAASVLEGPEHQPNSRRGRAGNGRREGKGAGGCGDTETGRCGDAGPFDGAQGTDTVGDPERSRRGTVRCGAGATAGGVSHGPAAGPGVQGQGRVRVMAKLNGSPCEICGAFFVERGPAGVGVARCCGLGDHCGAALPGCRSPEGLHHNEVNPAAHRIWP
jgi:hypothetical protein